MKSTFLIFLLVISLESFSQTIHARILKASPIEVVDETLKYDTVNNILKTKNPKAIISFDMLELIDGDTIVIHFNKNPEITEDQETSDRIWADANDASGRECIVTLFHYKESNYYQVRILFLDTNSGYEYLMNPLKVDVIPYK